MIEHLCKPGDIEGMGKHRPCVRVIMCKPCGKPLVNNAPTCGECSYCLRLQERRERKPRKTPMGRW